MAQYLAEGTRIQKNNADFSISTKSRRSDYARNILVRKSISVYTKNKSIDNFPNEKILLHQEPNHIENNFEQQMSKDTF